VHPELQSTSSLLAQGHQEIANGGTVLGSSPKAVKTM